MRIVRLSDAETREAVDQAAARQRVNEAAGRVNARSLAGADPRRDLELHTQGSLAERAVAKLLGIGWSLDVAAPHRNGDVGPYDVRSTSRRTGRLILHPDDPDGRRVFLVVTAPPRFYIVGSILAGVGKRAEWWVSTVRHPAWFVPQGALNPV